MSATFTVSESGYSGTFTAISSNTADITVSPGSGSSSTTFTVTATSTATGQQSVLLTDASGNHGSVTVDIPTCVEL